MNKKKSLAIIAFIIVLALTVMIVKQLNRQRAEQWYLSFGDGLTAGINEVGGVGPSYVDYLGEQLIKEQKISSFQKSIARYNLTSNNLLRLIEQDGLTDGGKEVSFYLQKSSLITISVGHQDISAFVNSQGVNPAEVETQIARTMINIYQMVEEIRTLSAAQIILVGLYNYYPSSDYQELFSRIKEHYLDLALDAEVDFCDLTFLSSPLYLPNSTSPFPNALGQEKIAASLRKLIR